MQQAVQRGHAVSGHEGEHLDAIEPQLVESGHVARRDFSDLTSTHVTKDRSRRLVVRLCHVDEILAIGGQRDVMVQRRIGQPFVTASVQLLTRRIVRL